MSSIALADRMAAVQESATMALNSRAKQLAAEGKTVYNFTAGELAAETPEYIRKHVAGKLHHNKYTPAAGLPELRTAIDEESREFYDLDWIKPVNVVVTAASKPGLYATLLALINEGDEVVVPMPAWVTYVELIKLVGGKVVPVPLTADFDIDAPAVLAKVTPKTKAIILNSPNNPAGSVFSRKGLEALAEGLKGSDATVISDDMYAKLVYDKDFVPVPCIGFERIVIVNGFSKSQALTGWRIGYLIADEHVAKAIADLLGHITGNASVTSQHAALSIMERKNTPPADILETLERQRQLVDEVLKDTPGISYHLPGGAFYYYLDLRQITEDSLDWCERLLDETGVALVPGEAFGTPGFARLSFVADEVTLRAGLAKIKAFAGKGSAS
jgi:aspartate aminotransferase